MWEFWSATNSCKQVIPRPAEPEPVEPVEPAEPEPDESPRVLKAETGTASPTASALSFRQEVSSEVVQLEDEASDDKDHKDEEARQIIYIYINWIQVLY